MKKRIPSLILAVVIFLSIVHIGGVKAKAETAVGLKASPDMIRILKAEEGFSKTPYWDYAQWTVGYGTRCPDDKLDYYKENGISEEEAEALLQTFIIKFEEELDKFMIRTGVALNQHQYDALLLLSYNCGTAWSYSTEGVLYKAVVSGATGNALIDAFSRWCNAGGEIKTFLLRRRLSEANMYLNGVYSQTPPDNFGYVLYDACGGTAKPNVQGYDTQLTAAPNPTPTYPGYTFNGWYTARTGGTLVTTLDATTKNKRVYAHWLDADGNDPTQDTQDGVTVTVTTNGLNVRQGPGTNYPSVGALNTGEQVTITETAAGGSFIWGKFYGGWVCLQYTNYDTVTKPEESTPAKTWMGTVKVSDQLRIRSGPSTGYSVVGYLNNGDRVEILEQKIIGSMVWGKIAQGWISLSYVTLDPDTEQPDAPEETVPPTTVPEETVPPTTTPEETVPPTTAPEETVPPTTVPEETVPPTTSPEETVPETNKPTQEVWTGTVKVKDTLRIRSGPSTANAVVGYLANNAKVTVTEKTTSGSMTWGKISQGWISLDYVVFEQTAAPQKITGTVKVSDFLRVRSGPGTSYSITAYLSPNTKVEITEQKKIGNTTWGKIAKGWVSLDYVVLDGQEEKPQTVTKTITADCLRIRSAAGTTNKIVGYLYKGAKVEILETKKVGNTTWGRIAQGWISLDYVK